MKLVLRQAPVTRHVGYFDKITYEPDKITAVSRFHEETTVVIKQPGGWLYEGVLYATFAVEEA